MTSEGLWSYREGVYGPDETMDETMSVIGFDVEAVDGKVGRVEEESNMTDDSYIVADVGSWLSGRKVVLPASTVTRIDKDERKVHISQTKQEIQDAPEYDPATYRQSVHRQESGGHYASAPPRERLTADLG
ncbi:PRC-barrel domain containing protein [Streptosporangium sp. NPDC000509]|uniref:PRC-barrel domain containing protein n=1 Tax=Streptosporangium sp. NPDC000509 TaxID=3366186 RepID=UPI00367BA0CA